MLPAFCSSCILASERLIFRCLICWLLFFQHKTCFNSVFCTLTLPLGITTLRLMLLHHRSYRFRCILVCNQTDIIHHCGILRLIIPCASLISAGLILFLRALLVTVEAMNAYFNTVICPILISVARLFTLWLCPHHWKKRPIRSIVKVEVVVYFFTSLSADRFEVFFNDLECRNLYRW